MSTNEQAATLHDRATRGGPLSPEEQTELEHWYANQDQRELALLARTASDDDLIALRAQVDEALYQVTSVTTRIQALLSQNDELRVEIKSLQRQLSPASARS